MFNLAYFQDRDSVKARLARRSYPIHIYAGPNGSGKSFLAAYDTIPSLDYGRPVLSTMRLLDYRNPRPCPGGLHCDDPDGHYRLRRRVELVDDGDGSPPRVEFVTDVTDEIHPAAHPYYVPFTSYQQLLDWRDGDVIMDEVAGVASSRESSSMPSAVALHLQQLRRRNVSLRVTAPSVARADVIIRECAQAVTITWGHFGKRHQPNDGEAPRLWRENRLIVARTYDATLISDWESEDVYTVDPIIKQFLWGPNAQARSVYDTYDSVLALGFAGESGACLTCGGRRRMSQCSCADHGGTVERGRERKAGGRAPSPADLNKLLEDS